MKTPIEAYNKLYNSFLLDDFPNIEKIYLKPKSLLQKIGDLGIGAPFTVNIHLKEYNHKGIEACTAFGRKLEQRIFDLNNYFGQAIGREIKIYYNGKLICTNNDFYIRKV